MARGKGQIAVLGSLVVDLLIQIPQSPRDGETLLAQDGRVFAGGKGLNQAVGLRRLGVQPHLLGQVGDDALGAFLLQVLRRERMGVEGVVRHPTLTTGTAVPIHAPHMHYILQIPGANRGVDPGRVLQQLEYWGPHDYLMMQSEVNRDANLAAALWTKDHGGLVVVDPSPATETGDDLLFMADFVTPNRVELGQLVHRDPPETLEEAQLMAEWLLSRFPGLTAVVATLDAWGACAVMRQGHFTVAAASVAVVDTTAAGDAFNAALVWSLARGSGMEEALGWAVAAGGRAVQTPGALPSLPYARDLVRS